MKRVSKVVVLLMVFSLLSGLSVWTVFGTEEEIAEEDFRGVWVSTVLNLDFPSKPGMSPEDMKAEINSILDRAAELNLNAVILQVRPAGDALYKSELFPWSEYLTGEQGKAPANAFDPLSYWIEQAHRRDIELHAWINPYRVSHSAAKRNDVSTLSPNNPAKLNPSWVIAYKNGLYFDPGLPETKKLIIDGVSEIVKNYDVDGIHLDDYFYPGTDFQDGDTYARYGNRMNKDDWRRENVNEVVRGIQAVIKEIDPGVRFGVSPFAIWQNRSSSELGSDTKGNETYKSMYADTRRWVKEGWLDYICPQIYWYITFPAADYKKVLDWWIDVCSETDVDLYVGHAAYKEQEGQAPYQGEMLRQLNMNAENDIVKGSVFFRYGNLKGNLGEQIKAFYTERRKHFLAQSGFRERFNAESAIVAGICFRASVVYSGFLFGA